MSMETNNGVRILHVGNVLLDRPIARLRYDVPEHRREELRDAFALLMKEVDEKQIRLVLFSGNLVDNAYTTNDTVAFFMREFGMRPECHFVIAPGPRDCYVAGSIYRSGRLPRNVHVFTEEILSRFDFDDLGVTVYGWAFLDKTHRFSPAAHKRVADPNRLNILCGFCEIDEEDTLFCPVSSAEIAQFGASYAALTSERPHEGFSRVGNTVMSYSGHFESTSFLHKQMGGVNFVTAAPVDGGGWQLSVSRNATGIYRYAEMILDVSHMTSKKTVAQAILARIAEERYNPKTVLRVRLRGSISPDVSFEAVGTAEEYGVYSLDVRDETVPTDGTEYLLRDMSAKGELYRYLYSAMTEGTPESRARAARVFRIGYAALRGKDFSSG